MHSLKHYGNKFIKCLAVSNCEQCNDKFCVLYQEKLKYKIYINKVDSFEMFRPYFPDTNEILMDGQGVHIT